MKKIKTRKIVIYGMLMALTTVMTMVIQIPTPATNGYLNLGDMVVFIAALILGRKGGLIVGGLGSGMADILLGYSHYAPITLIVKGIEGYIAGRLFETNLGEKIPLIPTIIGGIWMAFGYYFAEIFMYGSKAALVTIPGNLLQGFVGATTAVALYTGLKRTRLIDLIE